MSAAAAETGSYQHFRILRRADGALWKLGEGGMGATYKAVDANLGVAVALKLIRADLLNRDPSARSRFIREAKAAASLRHRHVATVYHLGDDGQNFFYAMEFVDGETLEDRVKRVGPLPVEKALTLALQASRALMAAHKVGLVHRDLKPANLMLVDEADEDDVLKVIDFGLAKSAPAGGSGISGGADYKITQTGFSAGFSPGYASPEQCQYLEADIRSDIYSLGVTLWFVLTGELPFTPTTGKPLEAQVFELQSKHVHVPPPLEKLAAVGVPETVRELLARMLAKDPADRPQTPADLRREIEACQRASSAADPGTVPPPYSFSLEDLLRQRGNLDWRDLSPLLAPLAAMADDLAASGPAALASFTPRHLRAVFPSFHPAASSVPGDRPLLLTEFLRPAEWAARWPNWTLLVRSATTDTNSVPTARGTVEVTLPPAPRQFRDAPQALAALTYELLDGQPPPGSSLVSATAASSYKPLPALNEAGNETLRRALLRADHGFPDAKEFGATLTAAAGNRGSGSGPPQPAPRPPVEEPPRLRSTPPAADQKGKRPFFAFWLLALLLLGGGSIAAWQAWHRQPAPSPSPVPTPPPLQDLGLEAVRKALPPLPVPTPSPPQPTVVPTATPLPTRMPTPTPEPTVIPTPRPTPTPELPPSVRTGTTAGERLVVEIAPGVRMAFRWCPPGSFTMGSPTSEQGRDYDEKPHRVILSKGFWLAETEATQRVYREVTGSNPSYFKGAGLEAPVESVSWEEAAAFCQKLTERERRAGRLPAGWEYRLPTETQWEYACRAETKGAVYNVDARTPWNILGERNAPVLDAIAWYGGNSGVTYEGVYDSSGWKEKQKNHQRAGTHPVGQKRENNWGLYDMIGNVWEWCADWYDKDYPADSVTDPESPRTGVNRVRRGGSWYAAAARCRAAFRGWDVPGFRDDAMGFRPALVPSQQDR